MGKAKVSAVVRTPGDQIKVSSDHRQATVDNVVYRWYGGFGSVILSCERGLKYLDLRMIGNVIFKVEKIESRGLFTAPLVHWVPAHDIDADWLKSFKSAFFGCN